MSQLLEAALGYAARGWPVLPLHGWTGASCTCGQADCSSPAKHPRTKHGLKDATTDTRAVRSWWGRWPEANVGLRTGDAFDVLDVDGDDGFTAVAAAEAEHGALHAGPTSLTGGGGAHRLYVPTGAGNRAGLLDHVDWRGRDGYIVAPPSLHRSGERYAWDGEWGPDAALLPPDPWLLDLLFPPPPPPRPAGAPPPRAPDRSSYARRAFDAELGELARAAAGTRNHTLNTCAFNLFQLVEGGELADGDVTSALERVAAGIGLGQREITSTLRSARAAAAAHPRTAPALRVVGATAPAAAPALTPPSTDDDLGDLEPTTWEPVDLAKVLAALAEGTSTNEPPALYPRTDDVRLLYAAKMHAFNGEPESGKSWAAQHAAVHTIDEGHHVTYIDFEDDQDSVVGRLLALGAKPGDVLARFTYIRPSRPLSTEAVHVLRGLFAHRRPALVILDGLTEAMAIDGLDPLDNVDVAKFFTRLPRRLARLGAAVIIVDHVTKDTEKRGRWAIGAQHKMAALDGAAYTFEIVTPFGRGKHGITKVSVTKDRPGHVRQHAAGTAIAELHLTSTETGVTAQLRPPSGASDDDQPFRPSVVMERVSKALERGPSLTMTALRKAVKGRSDYVDLAAQLLEAEGFIGTHRNGQARYHHSIKPYRADSENP